MLQVRVHKNCMEQTVIVISFVVAAAAASAIVVVFKNYVGKLFQGHIYGEIFKQQCCNKMTY